MRDYPDPGPAVCKCGRPYALQTRLGQWYWCETCDAHAMGCVDPYHTPGRCTIKPVPPGGQHGPI